MALSAELISEFVKITNDNKSGQDDKTVYGTVKTVSEDGKSGTIMIDGSSELTPFTTTCMVKGEDGDYPGDRVRITIRNHNAIVTGNMTDISASAAELLEALAAIAKFEEGTGLTIDSLVTFKNNLEAGNTATTINGGCIKTGTITFNRLDSNAQKKVNDAVSDAEYAADAVDGWGIETDDGTYIDGEMIYSDSIYAKAIHLGGRLKTYKTETGTVAGGRLGFTDGFNSKRGIGIWADDEPVYDEDDEIAYYEPTEGQCICTDEAARISFVKMDSDDEPYDTASFIASYSGLAKIKSMDHTEIYSDKNVYIDAAGGTIKFQSNDEGIAVFIDDSFRPYDESTTLGTSSHKWGAVYATNGTIQTSDRNEKNSIENLPDKYIDMFDILEPKRFKMNAGTSGRYHIGYIAQDVEDAMAKVGIDSLEFGGFVKGKDENGNDVYMLRYDEFDAIRDAKIKRMDRRLNELEKRLMNLETKEVG